MSSPIKGTLLSLNFLYHSLSLAIKTGIQFMNPTLASIAADEYYIMLYIKGNISLLEHANNENEISVDGLLEFMIENIKEEKFDSRHNDDY